MANKLNIGVLISGSGTNLQAILDASKTWLNVNVSCVVSSRPNVKGIERAQNASVPVLVLDKAAYENPKAADAKIVEFLHSHGVEYVVMAGYMRLLTSVVLDAFPMHVLNIHPALLPSFKGAHAIEDAFGAGVKVTGVTVHFANTEYDMGPIIAQRAVYVQEGETLESLESRIHITEHALYPYVLSLLANGAVSVNSNGKVEIKTNIGE